MSSKLFLLTVQHAFRLASLMLCIALVYVIIFSRSINTYGRPRKPYEGLHITKKHIQTNASYTSTVCLQRAGRRSRSRGRALYGDASRAAYVRARPASLKGRRSRTRGRGQCVLVKIWRSIEGFVQVRLLHFRLLQFCIAAKVDTLLRVRF